jgi:predicted ATPase/class 3 adenylate cyclase
MAEQPSGTVTMLFTDIEGSTRLLQQLGRNRYSEALELHRQLLREAFDRYDGYEVDCDGDSFFVAFRGAGDAVAAARQAQQSLAAAPWPQDERFRVRMGVHSGEPLAVPPKYVGIDVHRAARIMAAGHGGQVLLSQSTRDLIDEDGLGGDSLVDLGEHRLKDLSSPQRIYQLGDRDFPPLKSLHQTNLPVQPTPLIGRERELDEVLDLARTHRLVTLTGPGGSGKTRLALQAAAELLDEFSDGVWFVSLAALTDPALIESTIASAVGTKDSVDDFLGGKSLLLVLDNLEQLLPDAGPIVGGVNAGVIATSREPLHVYGEQEYAVPTLPAGDAVALFTERARQVKPAFDADEYVAAIARRLDGLPLALELAAARVKVLTPKQIFERLDRSLDVLTAGPTNVPERQRTLRATIDWSYTLLGAREQQLFRRLAVFAGSFDFDAAEGVCSADIDGLQSLVEKSLLRQTDEGRFFMLETIREFAGAGDDDEILALGHADYFCAFAERAEPELVGRNQVAWFERLETEHDNLRAALQLAHALQNRDLLLRLGSALWRFWSVRGHWNEGRRALDGVLAATVGDQARRRAQVLQGAADIAWRQGRYDEGRAHLEESLAIWREIGDRWGETSVLHFRGNLESSAGNNELARELWEDAQQRWRELGDDERFAATVFNLGLLAAAEDEHERAIALFEQSSGLAEAIGHELLYALSIQGLGLSLVSVGRTDEGATRLREALATQGRIGDKEAVAICLIGLADALELSRKFESAAFLLGSADAVAEDIGFAFQPDLRRLYKRITTALRSELGDDAYEAAHAAGHDLGRDEAIDYALGGSEWSSSSEDRAGNGRL